MFVPQIIYEDNDLLILNKPSGLVVNSSETQKNKFTLEDWMRDFSGQDWLNQASQSNVGKHQIHPSAKDSSIPQDDFFKRAGIVHRLDKETSGIILVAKKKETFLDLQRQFKERNVSKSYKTLLLGKLNPQKGRIENKIGRNPKNRMRFSVVENGKKAVTEYKVIKYLKDDEGQIYSFVLAQPKTGRTHQIRVHFSHLGNPVIGDKLYTFRKQLKRDQKMISRQFLHASSIAFVHPGTKSAFQIEAEMSKDLQECLKGLRKTEDFFNP